MKKTARKPDMYLKILPAELRDDVVKLDAAISKVMKGLPRTLWEGVFWGGSDQTIIGYGDFEYTGSRGTKVNWFIVGLALQKNYISVYVTASDGKQYLARKYKDQLGKVKVGSSSISFRKLSDVKLDKLLELVARSRELAALTP
jgi:hypothetical protein